MHPGYAPATHPVVVLGDVEATGRVLDLREGIVVTFPGDGRDGGAFLRWLVEQRRGDVAFDDAKGGGLFGLRGARLLRLEAGSWEAAAAIPNAALRRRLEAEGGPTVMLGDARTDEGGVFVAVLTGDGRLAVLHIGKVSPEGVEWFLRKRDEEGAPVAVAPDPQAARRMMAPLKAAFGAVFQLPATSSRYRSSLARRTRKDGARR